MKNPRVQKVSRGLKEQSFRWFSDEGFAILGIEHSKKTETDKKPEPGKKKSRQNSPKSDWQQIPTDSFAQPIYTTGHCVTRLREKKSFQTWVGLVERVITAHRLPIHLMESADTWPFASKWKKGVRIRVASSVKVLRTETLTSKPCIDTGFSKFSGTFVNDWPRCFSLHLGINDIAPIGRLSMDRWIDTLFHVPSHPEGSRFPPDCGIRCHHEINASDKSQNRVSRIFCSIKWKTGRNAVGKQVMDDVRWTIR
jgi:hypothetical protein